MSLRPYQATHLRNHTPISRPRHFGRIDTAVPRMIQLLIQNGHPGDVVEIAHSEWGFQIATVKIHVGGKLTINLMEKS